MAKLTAVIVTLLGVLLCLPLAGINVDSINKYAIPLGVLIIGIGKLVRNFSK